MRPTAVLRDVQSGGSAHGSRFLQGAELEIVLRVSLATLGALFERPADEPSWLLQGQGTEPRTRETEGRMLQRVMLG